ncbi:MAG: diguanylate cyclase [Gordonibacter sp.]|nr:diguanylate cyclase [Gordonibacter sp.]
MKLTFSTGIALVPKNSIKFETVYDRADSALYKVKSEGKAMFRFYDGSTQL